MSMRRDYIGLSKLQATFGTYAPPLQIGESLTVRARIHATNCFASFTRISELPKDGHKVYDFEGVNLRAVEHIKPAFQRAFEKNVPFHVIWTKDAIFTMTPEIESVNDLKRRLIARERLAAKYPLISDEPKTP